MRIAKGPAPTILALAVVKTEALVRLEVEAPQLKRQLVMLQKTPWPKLDGSLDQIMASERETRLSSPPRTDASCRCTSEMVGNARYPSPGARESSGPHATLKNDVGSLAMAGFRAGRATDG